MAEKLDILIQDLTFYAEDRANLVFSDPTKIRLDSVRNVVELKKDALTGKYPTDANIYVISPLFQPKAVRQWWMFQAFIDHVFRGTTALTSDGFRLHDGTNQYWHNGSAWVVNTTNWNTEAQVVANISTFPDTARKIRVVVNLVTTNGLYTPSLSLVKVAYKAKIQYMEDLIYRSLAPSLRSSFRTLIDFAFKAPFPGGTSLPVGPTLDAAKVPVNIIDADSVFDHTLDPDHLNNLLISYNTGTRVATLSGSIPVGNVAFIQLVVEPEVIIETTSQDFSEVEKVPSVIIDNLEAADSTPGNQDDFIVNKTTNAAIRLPAPYRFNIRGSIILLAPGAVDLTRMIDSIVEYMENNETIRSVGLDRRYRMMLVDEFSIETTPTVQDLHSARASFQIFDVVAYKRPAVSEFASKTIKLRGNMDINAPPS